MTTLARILFEFLQTGFRLLPWPTKTGLRPIGEPTPDSPVLVTCNYDLTVRRLMRSLRGHDVWLLVAPSGGINVWCAAAGGHFSTHSVVSALKTSGINDRVHHRTAILPQLAATGVVSKDVRKRAGWRVEFGPVDYRDIPEYLANGRHTTPAMRHVTFSAQDRFEMAAAWAVPTCVFAGPILGFMRPAWGVFAVLWTVLLALFVFFEYEHLGRGRRVKFVVSATVLVICLAGLIFLDRASIVAFAIAGPILAAVVTGDYAGSTPIEDVGYFQEGTYKITLDSEKCVGVYRCVAVCPEAVFEQPAEAHAKVIVANPDHCVRCAACIVQCPADALYLQDADGRRVEPDTIRRYKLNLLGRRSVAKSA